MALKWTGLWIVILSAVLATGEAGAQVICDSGSSAQGVAVRLRGYTGSRTTLVFDGKTLKLGTGPQPGDQEVVFGLKLDRRMPMSRFSGKKPEIHCRDPRPSDGPRPKLDGGICWAVLTYEAGEDTCWHLKVQGEPTTPPFRVFIGQEARLPRKQGKNVVGWNVEHDLPRTQYVQVKILPPTESKAAKEQALLFETGPVEISQEDVPKTLDCKEIFSRIVQSQLACQPSCASPAVDQYLVPYLGDPPGGDERGKTESPLGVGAAARVNVKLSAARAEWLKKADTAWNGECRLPWTSLTFESAK